MPFEVTLTVARSVKVPAAEDEDESGSPKKPAHAAVSATTITRFMLCASEHAVEGRVKTTPLPGSRAASESEGPGRAGRSGDLLSGRRRFTPALQVPFTLFGPHGAEEWFTATLERSQQLILSLGGHGDLHVVVRLATAGRMILYADSKAERTENNFGSSYWTGLDSNAEALTAKLRQDLRRWLGLQPDADA